MLTEEQLMKMKEHSKKGWILELDLEHDAQNSYPLPPEKKVIENEQMSGYQKPLMADLNLDSLTPLSLTSACTCRIRN